MRRIAIIALAALCGIAVAVAVASGLIGRTVRSASITSIHTVTPSEVRFLGGPLPSALYMSAGADQSSLNVYRAQTSLSAAQRITNYGENRGVTGFAIGHDGQLVVAAEDENGSQDIRLLDGPGAGSMFGGGDAPALAPDGRLAYDVPFLHGFDGDVEVVVDRGRARPVFRVSQPDSIFEALWSSRDELALVVGQSSHATIVLDPGGAQQVEIPYQHDPGFPGTNGVAFTPGGDLTFTLPNGVAVRSTTGVVHMLALSGWDIQCWTPNGKLIVSAPDPQNPLVTRIGAFDPHTNKVAPIGRLEFGVLAQIVCPGG